MFIKRLLSITKLNKQSETNKRFRQKNRLGGGNLEQLFIHLDQYILQLDQDLSNKFC